jgi:hypothetical protein
VIAIDGREGAREHPVALGADLAMAPGADTAAQVRAATFEGRGVDVPNDSFSG